MQYSFICPAHGCNFSVKVWTEPLQLDTRLKKVRILTRERSHEEHERRRCQF